jgi:hypothetical protein
MNAHTVQHFADYLASIDADWRLSNGYTGRPVHKREYWKNMAARILADSVKLERPKKKIKRGGTSSDAPTPQADTADSTVTPNPGR